LAVVKKRSVLSGNALVAVDQPVGGDAGDRVVLVCPGVGLSGNTDCRLPPPSAYGGFLRSRLTSKTGTDNSASCAWPCKHQD